MTSNHETMQCCNLILQFLYRFIFELDNTVAAGTYKMVVVFAGQNMFIAGLTVMQEYLARQTGFNKQLESAVNRCVTNTGIAGFDFKVEFFNTDMLVG